MSKVFLGVGHGGSDPGAIGNGLYEKSLNLSIATHCKNELERNGVSVRMSRYTDEDDRLAEEIRECNAYDPDLCVDVHNNAGGGDGFEVYYSHTGGKSLEMAKNIEREVVAIGQNSRGCKTKLNDYGNDWFGFIRQTKAPATLVECAFIDTKDVEIVDTEEERKTMGIAIAKGIIKTLGVSQKPVDPTPPTPNPSNLKKGDRVRVKRGAKTYTGGNVASFVYDNIYSIDELTGARAVLDKKGICSPFNVSDLILKDVAPTPPTPVKPSPSLKSIEQIAAEVINGDWGNGKDRENRLTAAGYDYDTIQGIVDQQYAKTSLKSVDEIAREVIRGDWGNGKDRINRLSAAGYNAKAVQTRVDELY